MTNPPKENVMMRAPQSIYLYMILEILALELARQEAIWGSSNLIGTKPSAISIDWLLKEMQDYLGDRGFFKVFPSEAAISSRQRPVWQHRILGLCTFLESSGHIRDHREDLEGNESYRSYSVTEKGLNIILPYNLHLEGRCGHCHLHESGFPSWAYKPGCPESVGTSSLPVGLGGTVSYEEFMLRDVSNKPEEFDVVRTLSHRQVMRGIAIGDDLREELDARYGAIYHYSRN